MIIFQERKEDGKRVISSIAEISYDSGELKLKSFIKHKFLVPANDVFH